MPDKSSKRIFLKITLTTLILITLIYSSYFIIRSNRAKEEIKGLFISKLENSLDRGIYIGKVKKYSLHSLVLSDFKVFKDKSLKNEDLLLKADEMIIEFNLDYFQALKRKLALTIQEITFIKPQMTLVRDSEGRLDFLEKFNINLDIFTNFVVKKINIDNGLLYYEDYMTMKAGSLLTTLNSLNGHFDLANLPKVELDCTALRSEDSTPLALKGYFFTGETDYSLDFTFRNSDITHFQYYLTDTKTFNFKKGLFDLDLNLSHYLDDLNDLKDILTLHFSLPDDFQITGKSVLKLHANGTIDNYLVSGECSIGQGMIEGYNFSGFNMEFDYNRDGFHLKNLKTECGGGIIEGKGTIILQET